MNSPFIAFENDEWCHSVARIGSPAIACVSFLSISFFLWILLLFGFKESLSMLKIKHWSCS